MQTSANGIALMHHYEQCRLLAYPDPGSPLFKALQGARIDPYNLTRVPDRFVHLSGSPWTIGWGDTGGWKVGDRITQERADALFAARLAREFEPGVLSALARTATQAQFDAFVSLAYNIGVDAFRGSTALRKFNLGDSAGAADAILLWNKSNRQVMKGLQRRRFAERLLFLGSLAGDAAALAEARYP